jgi:AcrR family transcriptional regulator
MSDGMGLRERKRLAAMRRIQAVALDLFDEHGFTAVTIERIAEACEVSPSTVYRYFGTKEQLILWDEYDPLMVERLAQAPLDVPVLELCRRVILDLMDEYVHGDQGLIERRMRYLMEEPAVEEASTRQMYEMSELLGTLVATKLQRAASDLEVQVFSHAVVGGLVGGLHHWYETGFALPLRDVLERTFDVLDTGMERLGASTASA